MAKFCISCGAANSDSANMCNRCGKMLPQKEIEWKQSPSVGTAIERAGGRKCACRLN